MGRVKDAMKNALRDAFQPKLLEIEDQSDQHRGHAGNPGGGETHFRIRIAASAFGGLSPVKQHRLIHSALDELMGNPIHALTIEVVD